MAPIESTYGTSYWSSIVTLVLEFLFAERHTFLADRNNGRAHATVLRLSSSVRDVTVHPTAKVTIESL